LTQSHENLHKEEQKKLDFHSKLIEERKLFYWISKAYFEIF
jgi:hypothetical protein